MSIATVAERLAAIQIDHVAGIVKAYDIDEIPNSLATANLPAFINVPGEAVQAAFDDDEWIETRTWYMLLYIAPIERPVEVAQRMAAAAVFLPLVRQVFADRDGLESLAGILSSRLTGDSGLATPLQYGGLTYAGIEFRLEVKEIIGTAERDY